MSAEIISFGGVTRTYDETPPEPLGPNEEVIAYFERQLEMAKNGESEAAAVITVTPSGEINWSWMLGRPERYGRFQFVLIAGLTMITAALCGRS